NVRRRHVRDVAEFLGGEPHPPLSYPACCGPGSRRPGSWLLRGIVVLVHVLPPHVLARLPGQGLKLLSRPRAVVVLVPLEWLVFVNTEQDERLLVRGFTRRGGVASGFSSACSCCSVSSIMATSVAASGARRVAHYFFFLWHRAASRASRAAKSILVPAVTAYFGEREGAHYLVTLSG